jgi:hypothetical protein
MVFPISEDISSQFTDGRLTSACLEMYSDTMPGGVFSVSGRFNSVVLSNQPISWNTLSAS